MCSSMNGIIKVRILGKIRRDVFKQWLDGHLSEVIFFIPRSTWNVQQSLLADVRPAFV